MSADDSRLNQVPRLRAAIATQQEKVAALRGFAGRMRAAMRDTLDLLRPEDPASVRLRTALEEKAP